MSDFATTMKNKAQEVGGSLNRAASAATENFKSATNNAVDAAKGAASKIAEEGQQAANYVGQSAEDATCSVGGRLKAAGESIRQNGPQDGAFGQATSTVAKTLEDTGEYLQQEGLQGIACDIATMIKKNPIASLFVGVGLGFMLARATNPRS